MIFLNFFSRLARQYKIHTKYKESLQLEEHFEPKHIQPLLADQLPTLEHKLNFAKERLAEAVEERELWAKSVEDRLALVDGIETQIRLIKEFLNGSNEV